MVTLSIYPMEGTIHVFISFPERLEAPMLEVLKTLLEDDLGLT